MSLIIPEKDVLLSISGTHTAWEDEPELVELATAGKLITVANGFDVVYEESELTGMAGTTTTFRIRDDELRLIRTGTINMDLSFEENVRHESLYDIGEGALLVQVSAHKIDIQLTENGGFFDLDYTIDVEGSPLGTIRYHIEVKPLK